MEVSSIVLAGGKSSRFGHNKVFKTIGDRLLLELVVNTVAPLSQEVILVGASQNVLAQSEEHPEVRTVGDVLQGKGPLGGIYSGLLVSNSFHNLVVASDMPFLNPALLLYMINISADFDVSVVRVGDLEEPLHAIYTKSCIKPIENLLRKSDLSIHRLFPLVRTRYVEADEVERFDPDHLSIFNINTHGDLQKAEEIARGKER